MIRLVAIAITSGLGLSSAACSAASPSPAPLNTSTGTSTLTAGRVGSLANPRLLNCAAGNKTDQNTTSEDIVAGPLIYPRAKLLARPGSVGDFYGGGVGEGADGSKFYKMGTFVKRGARVTVNVVPQARTVVRLQASSGSTLTRDEAVTYQACATGVTTAWVGGFDLTGEARSAACIPLEVRVEGEAQSRRIVISLFNGVCKNPPST